jgi:uncharacterized protein
MEILEQTPYNEINITACDGSICIINQKKYEHSFLLFHNQIIPWNIQSIDDICAESLAPIIALCPDCVIIGTGAEYHFLDAHQLQPLVSASIGYECMNSMIACGSYQLLAGDGRQVLAAIILEPQTIHTL